MKNPIDPHGGLKIRIGVICPDDGVNDDEYWQYLPAEGVTLLWTRYSTPKRFDPIGVEMVASYGDVSALTAAAQTLRITRPNVIAFCCNSCTFVHGIDGDARVRAAIAAACDCLATTVTNSQVEALKAMNVRRVAIGAPYRTEVTAKLQRFLEHSLEHSGFNVVATQSLGLTTEWEIGNSLPSRWAELAMQVNHPAAEAIVLACSGIRTASILEPLERELGKPVISASAATVWHSLRLAGVTTRVRGRGALFGTP
jgi:maleate isomerase